MSILELPMLGAAPDAPFPDTSQALDVPEGLLAWGGGLEKQRLLSAYSQGIFPWYPRDQAILWWSPAPRCVLLPQDVYLSRRTRRRYNSGIYTLTADTAFAAVMRGCAQPRPYEASTWINDDMVEPYCELHLDGWAHSLEVWQGDELVGGIYGLALGTVFFGESMYGTRTDASKIALVALCRWLQALDFRLLDCQVANPHLLSMGAVEMVRETFEDMLAESAQHPRPPGNWAEHFQAEQRW